MTSEAEEPKETGDSVGESHAAEGGGGGGSMSNADHLLGALGPPYARRSRYWTSLLFSSVPQGLLMALVALAFFNCYVAINDATWHRGDYHHALQELPTGGDLLDKLKELFPELVENSNETHSARRRELAAEGEDPLAPLRLGNGEWWYVGLLAGGGFVVGLLKVVWNWMLPSHAFPRQLPGFLLDVRELHGHDALLPVCVLACSAVSLGVGASVGPEAALGAVGTALGSLIFARRWRIGSIVAQPAVPEKDDDNNDPQGEGDAAPQTHWLSWILPDLSQEPELCAMDGITGGFGALFPAQYLSCLLVLELGYGCWNNPAIRSGPQFRHSLMEVVTRTGVTSTVAYLLFTGLQDRTLLEQITVPFSAVFLLPEIDAVHMLMALILGFLAGLLGLLGLLVIGIFGKLGEKMSDVLNGFGTKLGLREDALGFLLTPAIGGAILGLLCKAVPLLLGDGADQLGPIILLQDELGVGNIVATGFLKLVAVGISCGFGFVGGQIFPLLFTGTCMGIVVNMILDDVPGAVSIPCCMMAVPCAFLPIIFTFTTLASVTLAMGGAGTSPVFLACIVSHTTVAGVGFVHDLVPAPDPPEIQKGAVMVQEEAKMVEAKQNLKEDSEALEA